VVELRDAGDDFEHYRHRAGGDTGDAVLHIFVGVGFQSGGGVRDRVQNGEVDAQLPCVYGFGDDVVSHHIASETPHHSNLRRGLEAHGVVLDDDTGGMNSALVALAGLVEEQTV
jgi:hypothetical protein